MSDSSSLTRTLRYIGLLGIACVGANAATNVHTPMRPASHKSQFTLLTAESKSLTNSTLAAVDATATKGAISSDRKSISFSSHTIRLVIHTGPDTDMLSYRIAGVRNPTLIVSRGSLLKTLFVNNDEDMLHNVRFGAWTAKFPSSADSLLKKSVGTLPLQHADGGTLHGAELAITAPAQPGKYAYFCTVRGHANGGMAGIVVVR